MKIVLTVIGVLLVLSGGLWTLQGMGVVDWPKTSFMIGAQEWILYGLLTVAFGALLIWLPRRR